MIQHCRVGFAPRSASVVYRRVEAHQAVLQRTSSRTHAQAAYHPSQLLNLPGIKVLVDVAVGGRRSLIVPHVSVKRIQQLNWKELASLGFKGCVLDKDNTLTRPYSMALEPGVKDSLAECQAAFKGNVVVFSNSAGLEGFDKDLSKAREVEAAVGVHVLRHKNKKPAGGCSEIVQRFGCEAHEVVAVGDRLLTDIVFGNLNGMMTVHVEPFETRGESVVVRAARVVERRLQRRAIAKEVPVSMNVLVAGMLPRALYSRVVTEGMHASP